jgi:hypothetical protein
LVQTEELFDTFCFTVCWQGMRDNCNPSGNHGQAQGADVRVLDDEVMNEEDGGHATPRAEHGQLDLASVKLALAGAAAACSNVGLAGKPEALQCALEQCSYIMRMAVGHEGKGKQKDHNFAVIGVLSSSSVLPCLLQRVLAQHSWGLSTCLLYTTS